MSDTTSTAVGSTVAYITCSSVTVALDTDMEWTDGKNYTLAVTGVPTPQFAYDTSMGSFVLSIGKAADGSYAWSDSN